MRGPGEPAQPSPASTPTLSPRTHRPATFAQRRRTILHHPETTAELAVRVAGTTPYPWPWDGAVPAERWAMLVIESAGSHPARETLDVIAGLERDAVEAGVPVYRVRVQGPAVPLARDAAPESTARNTLTARGWDGFFESGLDHILRYDRRDTLLLTGHWLEVGVHSTLRSANDRGYECAVVADACAAWDPSLQHSSLSSIEFSGGIFGAVTNAAAVSDALSTAQALSRRNK